MSFVINILTYDVETVFQVIPMYFPWLCIQLGVQLFDFNELDMRIHLTRKKLYSPRPQGLIEYHF